MSAIKSFAGLRNDVTAERFKPGDLAMAVNIDLDNSGKLLSRGGYLRKVAGAMHSLWSAGDICLFVSGTELRRLDASLVSSVVIRSDLTPSLPMSYTIVNGSVYYSNGKQTGIYGNSGSRTWGIVPPVYQPLATQAYGDMAPGRYQFALTYVRSDGQESGTGLADTINITTGAINFVDIPVSHDADVTHKIIYLTPCNGDVLYRALVLANATTSASYSGGDLFTPLATQFKQQAPAGNLVGYFSGYTYVGAGPWLHYSGPYGYELFDLRDYFGFDANITLFAPVQDGVFIGTEKEICFLQGRDPKTMTKIDKASYGVVPGTLATIQASLVKGLEKEAPDEIIPIWTAHDGICVGLSGGRLVNLTQDRYKMDAAQQGAAVSRTVDGVSQYVTVVRN